MAQQGGAKLGKPLLFEPPSAPCEGAVLWLHGFGDRPEGWASILKRFRTGDLPSSRWKWMFLRAPPVPQPAYGGRKVPAWGQFFSPNCVHVGQGDHEDPDAAGFYAASVAAVEREIDSLEKAGVPPSKVVVGGFSQGAALALEVALNLQRPIAGCVALSGWLTPRARSALGSKNPKPRFLVCHGTKDDMVGFDCAKAAVASLQDAGADVKFEEFKGLEHASCPRELEAVASFLFSSLSPSAEAPRIDWEEAESGSDSLDDDSEEEVLYVSKQALKDVKEKFEAGQQVPASALESLQNLDALPDDAAMVPIPIDVLADFDELLEKLGAKGAGEIFVKAAQAALDDSEREMSASQFREQMNLRATDLEEGEEEEADEEEGEEGSSDESADRDADADPTASGGGDAKRARTS
mmetsp:Transcript_81197/g.226021  ORF Transcript_81197/g.226021 Transcript_81197/m.226021 type:complete len:409 (+) Transcript_81197:65-1291(+)